MPPSCVWHVKLSARSDAVGDGTADRARSRPRVSRSLRGASVPLYRNLRRALAPIFPVAGTCWHSCERWPFASPPASTPSASACARASSAHGRLGTAAVAACRWNASSQHRLAQPRPDVPWCPKRVKHSPQRKPCQANLCGEKETEFKIGMNCVQREQIRTGGGPQGTRGPGGPSCAKEAGSPGRLTLACERGRRRQSRQPGVAGPSSAMRPRSRGRQGHSETQCVIVLSVHHIW